MTGPIGGEEWTRALVDAHGRTVRGYVARRISAADVDDVVSEVYVIAWRRAQAVPAGDGARAFLLAIARRVLANERRGDGRRIRLQRRAELLVTPPVGVAQSDGRVLGALARLRPADQEILRLAAWEELATSEIAVVLGCSAAAAAVRLSRARARLRHLLQEPSVIRTSGEARRR